VNVKLPEVHVVTTGWRHPTKHVCLASVASQLDVKVSHTYIEASEQVPARTKMQNLHDVIGRLAPDAVTVLVDGDDWLAHRRALARIALAHAEGAWATYGSFRNSDGSPGFARPYLPSEDYRTSDWRATHPKSFRAGLFQKIAQQHLRFGGLWIDRADDPAFMYPILEMAGRDRVQFLRDCLYVYNEVAGWHRTASQAELRHQAEIMGYVRALPRYQRLESLSSKAAFGPSPAMAQTRKT
jgi:hypothetical protein